MPEGVIVADRIHALVQKPSATLAEVLEELDGLRRQYGADTVIVALATELLTATARLGSKAGSSDAGRADV